MTENDLKPQRLMKLPEVMARVGLAKATIYTRFQNGGFPKPVSLGASSRWVESEIDAWIADLVIERDKAA
jgi:prophage regulatory protein